MPSWMNSIWKKRLYCGLLLACERPTGHQSISRIPQSKGYGFSFILWGIFETFEGVLWFKIELFCEFPTKMRSSDQRCLSTTTAFTPLESAFNFRSSDTNIAVYNAYRFVTERINTSTVFVQVSDHVIGTGQMANTSRRKSTGDFSRYIACKHKNNHKNAKKTFLLFI